jgi:sterol desaturase/sphingolipid hydroxylase (fatty acid hydroxylase superfamily)
MLQYIWNIILNNPTLSSPVIHVFLTTVETYIMYAFFFLFDFGFIKANRLKVLIEVPQTTSTYLEAVKTSIVNSIKLWIGVGLLTYILTGDINGGYSIQGIPRDTLPQLAPDLLKFISDTGVTIILVDLGLYWMHRAFHWGPLYKNFHSVHHEFHDTVAIHSMSAHVVEIYSALTLLFIIPRIVYSLIGIHPMVVYFTPIIMTAHGVLEHCGYDDYSDWLTFGLFSGSKMHMVHHQRSRKNFGFYTYLWDNLFGTCETYEEMTKNVK